MKKIPFSRSVESWHAHPYSTCRQVEISFLGMPQIAHFQVEKLKSSLPAVGGDERVEIKWLWWSPERQNPPKNVNMVMLRNGFFGNLWKWYAPERKFRAENGGLSRGSYPICTAKTVVLKLRHRY